jgi:hypothetical protein
MEDADWILLVQYRFQQRDLLITVTNIQALKILTS